MHPALPESAGPPSSTGPVADAVYDPEILAVLRAGCFCYVHGNSVGGTGTNPALLEAVAQCPRVMAVEGPFSRELLGETGHFFAPGNMAPAFRRVVNRQPNPEDLRDRVQARYRWDEVARVYMRLAEGRTAAYPHPGS